MNAKLITYDDINIVYEDNHILVVVKPHNIPTQQDITGDMDMLTLLKEYLVKTYNKPGEAYLGLVHRLDRPTGGVMVFAKTSKAAARLSEQIKDNTMEKAYLAVVDGVMKDKQGKLVHYLKKNSATNNVIIVPEMTVGAKRAELDYKILEEKNNVGLIRVKLVTGRSHQIRVQLASQRCSIMADVRYGKKRSIPMDMGLWAYELKLVHPTTKDIMAFRVAPDKEVLPWKYFNVDAHVSITAKNIY